MLWKRSSVNGVLVVLLVAPASWAASPVALSPGSSPGVQELAEPCPLFTWSAVGGAAGYELEIFALQGESSTDVAVYAEVPRDTTQWTPEPAKCLERGARYAWTVRAVLADGGFSDWSRVRLFEVLQGQSVSELEDSLGLARRSQARDDPRPGGSQSVDGTPMPPVVRPEEPPQAPITPKAVPYPVFVIDGGIMFPDGTRLSTSPLPDLAPMTYRVAGSVFRPRQSGVDYLSNASGGCLYLSAGDTWQIFNTDVHLPQGVTVQTMRMYYVDTSDTSNCSAWFTVYDLYGNIVREYQVSSVGSAGTGYNDAVPFAELIDNDTYSYVINWRPYTTGSTMQVCGFRLFYVHE